MPEQEGVIKYHLEFQRVALPALDIDELNTWRSILRELGLIGQRPDRYHGYGYGNVSMRDTAAPAKFLISASQTGHVEKLQAKHYSLVEKVDPGNGLVRACGEMKPSSEALSHAMFYRSDPRIQCVLHVHDPRLWRFGLEQALPTTPRQVEYGTPAMARAITDLLATESSKAAGVVIMAGHEDGLVTFGRSVDEAGARMLQLLIRAT